MCYIVNSVSLLLCSLPLGLSARFVFIAVRLVSEIQSLEALDVFGMLKESSLNSLTEVLTDRKVDTCYHVFLTGLFIVMMMCGVYKCS